MASLSQEPRLVRLKASPAPILSNLSSNGLHYAYISKRRVHMVPVTPPGEDPVMHSRVAYHPTGALMGCGWDSLDGKTVLRVDSTDAVAILDATGTETLLLHPVGADNVALFFSASRIVPEWRDAGPVLFAGLSSGEIAVVDVASGELLESLGGHLAAITSVFPIEDANVVISADDSGRALVWDIDSGLVVRELCMGDGVPITGLLARIDTVILAFANGILRFFSLSNPDKIAEVHAHSRLITGIALMGSRGVVVSVGQDGAVFAFDFTDLNNVKLTFSAAVPDAIFQGVSASSSEIATIAYDSHKLRVFDRK